MARNKDHFDPKKLEDGWYTIITSIRWEEIDGPSTFEHSRDIETVVKVKDGATYLNGTRVSIHRLYKIDSWLGPYSDSEQCFKCGEDLVDIFGMGAQPPFHTKNMISSPNNGVEFTTTGNYGSRVFDEMGKAKLRILICDKCLRKHSSQIKHFKVKMDKRQSLIWTIASEYAQDQSIVAESYLETREQLHKHSQEYRDAQHAKTSFGT